MKIPASALSCAFYRARTWRLAVLIVVVSILGMVPVTGVAKNDRCKAFRGMLEGRVEMLETRQRGLQQALTVPLVRGDEAAAAETELALNQRRQRLLALLIVDARFDEDCIQPQLDDILNHAVGDS